MGNQLTPVFKKRAISGVAVLDDARVKLLIECLRIQRVATTNELAGMQHVLRTSLEKGVEANGPARRE